MRDKIFPIIISIISGIALITTIIMDVIYTNKGYNTPGTAIWIILVSAVLLISIVQIFFRMSYVYGIIIFGAIVGIILSVTYIIIESVGYEYKYDHMVMFFIPHLIIYIILLISEIVYIKKFLHFNL